VGGGSLVWVETPDDEGQSDPDCEAHGDVDESFAARRLRRWIKGMFGGEGETPAAEPEPGREVDEP
jgi:hypothetical protein